MKVQYSIATMNKGIVVGTDHAAEAITGFLQNMEMVERMLYLYRLNKDKGKHYWKC